MRALVFVVSFLCFLLYLYNGRKVQGRRGEEEAPGGRTQRPERARSAPERSREVEENIYHDERLDLLRQMLRAAAAEVERAERRLDHLENLNQYGAVVNEKNIKRAEADLYKARRKRLTITNQIHAILRAEEKARG